MKEKTLIRLGISVARGLVDALESELVSKKKKKEKNNAKVKKVRPMDRSNNNSK